MRVPVKHVLTGVICASLVLGISAAGFGRVFLRRRAETPSEFLRLSRDWNRLLRSDIRINGGRGVLEVFGYKGDPGFALQMIRRACADENMTFKLSRGDNMALALLETETGVLRILAVEGISPDRTVVFILEQSLREYRDSMSPPGAHALDAVPVYPGSEVKSFLHLEKNRAQLEVSSVPASPGAVRSFFESAMEAEGWVRMMPPPSSSFSNIALFQKGAEVCSVMIRQSGAMGESVIAVLHKRLETR